MHIFQHCAVRFLNAVKLSQLDESVEGICTFFSMSVKFLTLVLESLDQDVIVHVQLSWHCLGLPLQVFFSLVIWHTRTEYLCKESSIQCFVKS